MSDEPNPALVLTGTDIIDGVRYVVLCVNNVAVALCPTSARFHAAQLIACADHIEGIPNKLADDSERPA